MSSFESHKAHFGPIQQNLIDYVTNDVLLNSRYLFTQTVLRIQFAYCTHCRERHRPETPLKHNTEAVCPKCQSTCTVKKSHVGRKYMQDCAYVVYYQKSILDPTIMTAVGLLVKRDYRGDYHNVDTIYSPSSSYVFEMGNSSMFSAGYYDNTKWYAKSTVVSEYSVYQNGTPCHYSRESIKEAIQGTPFQYSTWENYDEQDMVKFFGLYSKYPCIEYLTKMGYEYFVYAKLFGGRTFDSIKWNGKTLDKILKMNKQDIHRFKEKFSCISWGEAKKALALRIFQITRNDSNRPSIDELHDLSGKIIGYFQELKPMLKYQNLMYCVRFVERQFKKNKAVYSGKSSVISTWSDYISDCVKLGFDLKQENIVFPHNLHAAHESSTSQVQIKVSREAAKKIKKRADELEKYRFSFNGFVIRPALTAKEIIDEGKALRHCVGGYTQDHADGKTSILLIRKFADPDTPFYTMEIKDGKITQTYGFRHSIPQADIAEFVNAFQKEVLTKKRKVLKVNNQSKPSERQGVAV